MAKGFSFSPSVRISTPSSVHSKVCSHWADKLLSLVTTVHPSANCLVCLLPALIIGSIVKVRPGIRILSGMEA